MSQVTQYGRVLSVVVSTDDGTGIDFAEFRCVFTVLRGDYQTPNTCDVRIYNLSTSTTNLIKGQEFTRLSIAAGYPGNSAQIFTGSITQVRSGRQDQKDSWVDITAADGDKAYNFAYVAQPVPAGSQPGTVADLLLGAMQRVDPTVTGATQPTWDKNGYIRGRVLNGPVRHEARQFARTKQCAWSLQDNALTWIPLGAYIPSGEVPVISPTTGLIGVPEQTTQGLRVRTLLNPVFKIGTRIKLDSNAINQYRYSTSPADLANNQATKLQISTAADGIYYVMVANHHGDSRGNDWYTDLMCLAVNATVTNQYTAQQLVAINPAVNPTTGTVQRW